uniref:Uncharacterized protein n=1 Tax=Picea glauca TaxID=3330 RepID=A0A101M4S8_PICGL|nr:hypothetical protein ABT39_MTgene814 [Picea glauca]
MNLHLLLPTMLILLLVDMLMLALLLASISISSQSAIGAYPASQLCGWCVHRHLSGPDILDSYLDNTIYGLNDSIQDNILPESIL